MAGNKYLKINTEGVTAEAEATTASTGAPDAGKIVALNSDGEIDYSMVAAGFGVEDINVNGAYALPIATKNKWILTLLSDTSITFDMTGVPANVESASITVVIKQDSTGPFVPTFQAGIMWPEGIEPTWSTRPGAKDIIELFTVDGGATWFATVTGVDYVGIIRGTVALVANATAQLVGGFLRTAADYESASAQLQLLGSVIRTFISSNIATASIASAGAVQYTGVSTLINNALISAAGTLDRTKVLLTVSAAVSPTGNLFKQCEVAMAAVSDIAAAGVLVLRGVSNITASSDITPAGAVILLAPSVDLAADSTITVLGATTSPAVDLAAASTITALGTKVTPPLVVTLTDSTYLGTNGAPFNGNWLDNGMTTSISGGTGPYYYQVTVNRWRISPDTTFTSGCNIRNQTDNSIELPGTGSVAISNATSCSGDLSSSHVGALDLDSQIVLVGLGQDPMEFEVTLYVEDSLGESTTATAIARYNLAY